MYETFYDWESECMNAEMDRVLDNCPHTEIVSLPYNQSQCSVCLRVWLDEHEE